MVIIGPMEFLTLDLIKGQLRLDDIQTELEGDLLEMYGESAEQTVLNLIRRSIDDLTDEYEAVPRPLVLAALMLVDLSYQHRTMVTQANLSAVPYTFDLLIKPYMRLTTASGGGEDVPDGALFSADGRLLVSADGFVLTAG